MFKILNLLGGLTLFVIICHILELDWQLALMVLRDATQGRAWIPEIVMEKP